MNIMTYLFFVMCILVPVLGKTQFSQYTTICNAKDPKLNDCMVDAANKIMPVLAKGIKEYNLPPMDPLIVPRMDVGQDTGPVTIKFELTNSTQMGLGEIKWTSASFDMKNGRWMLNGTVKNFTVDGQYKTKGKILVLPIVGEGHSTFTLFNLEVGLVMEGKPTKVKDATYMKFKKFDFYFTKMHKTHTHMTNLFNGNKALGDQMNKFLNDNDKEISRYIKGSLEAVYSALFGGIFQKVLESIPYNELFKGV